MKTKISRAIPGWVGLAVLIGGLFLASVHWIDAAPAMSPDGTIYFEDVGAALTGVHYGSAAWGDYDNDGDLDILLTGDTGSAYIARIYRNDGDGSFDDIGAPLAGVFASSVAWGDYDNDGDLDILLTGAAGATYIANVAKVYRNDGSGAFADIGAPLAGVNAGAVAWGDYDNDGDLDILLTGYSGWGSRLAKIYRNDGDGTFTDTGALLPGVSSSAVAWGDYDNDGDLDILLTGYTGSTGIAKIYRNDGGGTWTDIGASLAGTADGSVAWGDYDNDGDLDILLAGGLGSTYAARVYRNDGNGVFNDIGAGLAGVLHSPAAWGDYDNDGDLDILLAGRTGSTYTAQVYRNDGNGTFISMDTPLIGVDLGSAAWGDYDGDGDLDVLLAGNTGLNYIAQVYRNKITHANTVPAAPTGLSASVAGSSVTLGWNASGDTQTPAAGLTYNLRVGVTPGGSQIASPMANAGSGYRRLPALGNANHGLTASLVGLSPGTYYWSVQAIDAAWAGSPFAGENSFTVMAQVYLPVVLYRE